ncbi:hypothetical protein ACOSP7_019931 [Xanthoceras sorbifolium]
MTRLNAINLPEITTSQEKDKVLSHAVDGTSSKATGTVGNNILIFPLSSHFTTYKFSSHFPSLSRSLLQISLSSGPIGSKSKSFNPEETQNSQCNFWLGVLENFRLFLRYRKSS